tara:strand:- start:156 stop:1478 length:1323 start_codon:yes stop_codon:yes gene_type:complete
MKVKAYPSNEDNKKIIFKIEIENEDNISPSSKYSLNKKEFYFKLPEGVLFEQIHPDHLALVSLLACHPFIGKRIIFPKKVSKKFFDAHKIVTKYIIDEFDENLVPWMPPSESRVALAYSGGADSTAALALLPKNTVSIFLDRPLPLLKRTLYNKDAPVNACKKLIQNGYEVLMVESNIEYVRNPVGFPVDVANSAPAILMASQMQFDAISFGTIIEAAYRVGHKEFSDYITRAHFKHWGSLFNAAGLPFLQVVAGISEVGTAIINSKSKIGIFAHSCMRGKWMKPCKNCWKCFRKLLLDSVINKKPLSETSINKLFKIKEAKINLSKFPIRHENVLAYSTAKYIELYNLVPNDENLMSLLSKRVRGDIISVNWMEKYYPPMFNLFPEKYKQHVKEKLEKYLLPMSEEEESIISNWSLKKMLNDSYYKNLNDIFIERLSKH